MLVWDSQTDIEPTTQSIPRTHPLSSGCCCAVVPEVVVPAAAEVVVPTATGTMIGGSEVAERDPLGLLVLY